MPLERQVIEKKDFPIGRRGYDPDAVDAHLAAIADEVDQLKTSSRRRSENLASSASAQVKAIVEAAESSAAAITSQAEDDAAEIRAGDDADDVRWVPVPEIAGLGVSTGARAIIDIALARRNAHA